MTNGLRELLTCDQYFPNNVIKWKRLQRTDRFICLFSSGGVLSNGGVLSKPQRDVVAGFQIRLASHLAIVSLFRCTSPHVFTDIILLVQKVADVLSKG